MGKIELTPFEYYSSSTIGDTISINTSYDKKSYSCGINLPVGFVFKPYNWLNIFSSITVTARYDYKDFKEENHQNWTSKTGQNISFAILPADNVEIGVYYINNFADYHDWQINVKYSF